MNAWLLLSIALAAAPATPQPDPIQAMLLSSAGPDTLRARLGRFAATTPRPRQAALALYYRAMSFDRSARIDSAVATYRRALELHATQASRDGLVDCLLRRRKPEDVNEVIRMLDSGGAGRGEETALEGDPARLAWAYALAQNSKRALEVVRPLETELARIPKWRYRLARIHYAAEDYGKAIEFLNELALESRGYDEESVRLLGKIASAMGSQSGLRERADQLVANRNRTEGEALAKLGGRIVRFGASDGATVGAYLFADTTSRVRAPGVVVLRDLGDDLAEYDSLIIDLRSAGLAVLVVDPRGTGWSVDSRVPLPETWEGREDALEARVERDVRDAIGMFGRLARVDTTRCLLVGVGGVAPIAVAIAQRDPHVSAVALIDPWVSPVERGAVIANAAKLTGYLQLGFVDFRDQAFANALFQAFDPAKSRRVEGGAAGRGGAQFVGRPELRAEFVSWASATAHPRATQRPRPRPR